MRSSSSAAVSLGKRIASLARRIGASALLGVTLASATVIGTGTEASVQGELTWSVDRGIDMLVTAKGINPQTFVGGLPMLAPDAWMVPGSISMEEVERLRALEEVEIAAPVWNLTLSTDQHYQRLQTLLPGQAATTPESSPLWRMNISYAVSDGTGVFESTPESVYAGGFGNALLTPPSSFRHYLPSGMTSTQRDESGNPIPFPQDVLSVQWPLFFAPSSLVAVDPDAESRLAALTGNESNAQAMESLSKAWQDYTTSGPSGLLAAAMRNLEEDGNAPPPTQLSEVMLTPGLPVPAVLASSGVLPDITLNSRNATVELGNLTPDPEQVRACGSAEIYGYEGTQPRCVGFGPQLRRLLDELPTQDAGTSQYSGPVPFYSSPSLPLRLLPDVPEESSGLGAGMGAEAYRGSLERTPGGVIKREGSADSAEVSVLPAAAPRRLSNDWQEELYRPIAEEFASMAAVGIVPVASYEPAASVLAGVDPMSASTLHTKDGPMGLSLSGRGAATAPAATIIPAAAVADMGSADLPGPGAGVVRLRLTRDADGTLPQTRIEEVSAAIADMGLTPTLVYGSYPTDVTVHLTGDAEDAWHGSATETWTELAATVRVTMIARQTMALLLLGTVAATLSVTIYSEVQASARRQRLAAVARASGWSLHETTRALIRQDLPGPISVVLLTAIGALISVFIDGSALPRTITAITAVVYLALWLIIVRRQTLQVMQPEHALGPATTAATARPGCSGSGRSRSRRRRGASVRARLSRNTPAPLIRSTSSQRLLASIVTFICTTAALSAVIIIERSQAGIGFSELGPASMRVSRVASMALALMGVVAALALLVVGMREERASLQRTHRLLSDAGWSRSERLAAERKRWWHDNAPLTALLIVLLALGMWGRVFSPWAAAAGVIVAGLSMGTVLTVRRRIAAPADQSTN